MKIQKVKVWMSDDDELFDCFHELKCDINPSTAAVATASNEMKFVHTLAYFRCTALARVPLKKNFISKKP